MMQNTSSKSINSFSKKRLLLLKPIKSTNTPGYSNNPVIIRRIKSNNIQEQPESNLQGIKRNPVIVSSISKKQRVSETEIVGPLWIVRQQTEQSSTPVLMDQQLVTDSFSVKTGQKTLKQLKTYKNNKLKKAQDALIDTKTSTESIQSNPISVNIPGTTIESINKIEDNRSLILESCALSSRDNANRVMTATEPLKEPRFDLSCNECSKKFSSLKKLYLHRKIHVRNSRSYKTHDNKFNYCPFCLDLIVVNGAGDKIYKENKKLFKNLYCYICQALLEINNLKLHYEVLHKKLNPFTYIFSEHSRDIAKYYCKICLKNFSSKNNLNLHANLHRRVGSFYCGISNKKGFPMLNTFNKYLDNHKANGRRKRKSCNMCGQIFSTNRVVSVHRYKHAGEELFKCEFCGYKFFTQQLLQEHKNDKHWNMNESCVCEYCGISYSTVISLNIHLKRHNKSKTIEIFSCDTCDLKFTTFKLLEQHKINTIHKTNDEYKCKKCEQIFCYKKLYYEHMFLHNAPPNKYVCIELNCNASFRQLRGLLIHYDLTHQCDYCSDNFNNRIDAKNHTATHFKNNSKSYCEYCDIHLGDSSEYREHVKKHYYICLLCRKNFHKKTSYIFHDFRHAMLKKYPCTKCCIRFEKSELLQHHLKNAHSGTEPALMKVETIPEIESLPVYMNVIGLPDHVLLNDTTSPYGCKYCEIKFPNLRELKVHIVEVHIYPFETNVSIYCNKCNAYFRRRIDLIKHKKLVHNLTTSSTSSCSNKCTFCKMKFKTMELLEKHAANHKHNSFFYCKLCNETVVDQGDLRSHYIIYHPNLVSKEFSFN